MAVRSAASPPRLLRAARSSPAASRLRPTLLLSLQAFDAAVRLQSFKEAASTLHLTPSAISHRIRNLEMMVGGPLFKRKHRAVQVTAAGRALAAATGRAFAELLRAAEPLTGAQATARLRLSVSPLFASAWLMPRLPSFMAGHPAIELVIESSLQVLDFDSDAVHAGVRVGGGKLARARGAATDGSARHAGRHARPGQAAEAGAAGRRRARADDPRLGVPACLARMAAPGGGGRGTAQADRVGRQFRGRPAAGRTRRRRGIGTGAAVCRTRGAGATVDRKSTRLNSSHLGISYAVFCLKKKN